MPKIKEILFLLLEAIAYGFFGSVFVLIVSLIEDFMTKVSCNPNGFSCGYGERGIPPGGVLIGATLSVIFLNLIGRKFIKSAFIMWFLILLTTSVSSLLIPLGMIFYKSSMTIQQVSSAYLPERIGELLGIELMIKLFVILMPFTVLFANRRTIIEKFKNRNALK